MKNKLYESKEYKNVRDLLYASVEEHSENVAFTIKTKMGKNPEYKNITFKDFKEELQCLGEGLINLGLKGKKIAVIGKNRYEWVVTYFSVINGVGTIVPLDKGLPEQEIELSLIRSHANAVVFGKDYIEMMKNIKANNKTEVTEYICMDEVDEFKYFYDTVEDGKKTIKNGSKKYLEAEINEEENCIILFTSGTTSLAKAVMLSHKNLASNVYAIDCGVKAYPEDVNIAFLPFHHTFGLMGLLYFLHCGTKNVFCDGLRHISENLKEYHVTVFVCVPLILEAMHKKIWQQIEKQGKTKKVRLAIKLSNILLKFGIDVRRKLFKDVIDALGGSLRLAVSGAAAIDPNVAKDLYSFGIAAIEGYGLTETSPIISFENLKYRKSGSVGLVAINEEVKIVNPNEEGIGEIAVKGPNVMAGYFENEEATKEVLIDGWFHTGDLGYVDKDGFLFITGREKNVIVLKNGKNIYPEELEVLINNLPYVKESMVFGLPKDDDLLLSAKIVYNKDYTDEHYKDKSEEELKDIIWQDIKQINSTLTKYKHIKNIIITDEEMIRTTTGKVKRFKEIEKIIGRII